VLLWTILVTSRKVACYSAGALALPWQPRGRTRRELSINASGDSRKPETEYRLCESVSQMTLSLY